MGHGMDRPVEALWVNYDGDEEPYTTIPPGHQWTVGTFESHPWRFRDARSGSLVREYVAEGGQRVLQLYDEGAGLYDGEGGGGGTASYGRRQAAGQQQEPAAVSSPPAQQGSGSGGVEATDEAAAVGRDEYDADTPSASAPERPGRAGGFDGLGNGPEQYTLASLLSVAVLSQEQQAVVVLGLTRFTHPLTLLVGVAEARGIVNAAGAAGAPGAGGGGGSRGRRPGLLATWANSLQVGEAAGVVHAPHAAVRPAAAHIVLTPTAADALEDPAPPPHHHEATARDGSGGVGADGRGGPPASLVMRGVREHPGPVHGSEPIEEVVDFMLQRSER
ncbi:Von Hippel-Lindau-like protein [Tetrabaena socialis]|uniref:von Hippel-Lindau-like protein n=1 Tax=Tetrabaena socialis TaxID=47790 RepID=A0A2J8AB46_9CHLO|nr:Von Hippel-Lindau-like protein [Tetrabaena socialis]|eukprot:PNH09727.1 Von Hippel-Lindau-like protein [Tetrabaena socialis]